jgi:nucleoside 2-deoxyribosyltransferase
MLKAYLAGPDVFLPDANAFAARKIEICRRHGIEGLAPLNGELTTWQAIFDKDLEMMEASDFVIANLTPFRGASADAGTLVELGWFLGRGRPIFAYSNAAADFSVRSRRQVEAVPDPLPSLMVEGFALVDNLMIPGAVERSGCPVVVPDVDAGFDSLTVFERCVRVTAERMGAY